MRNKVEVIKSYLKLLNIEFDFDNGKLVDVFNVNGNDLNYVGYYNEEKYNDKNVKVEKNMETVNVTIKENLVTVHYNSEEACNYDLGYTELNYNWYTTITSKIAYIFQDNDNLIITIGVDSKCTLKDENGNCKSEITRPKTIQDMEILEILTIPVKENVNFFEDVSEIVKPHLGLKEYSIYSKSL